MLDRAYSPGETCIGLRHPQTLTSSLNEVRCWFEWMVGQSFFLKPKLCLHFPFSGRKTECLVVSCSKLPILDSFASG